MGSSIKRSRTAAAMSSLPSVAAALFGLLGATGYASSADLPPAPAPVPIVAPAVYNWTGLYLGLNAGYISSDTTTASGGSGARRQHQRSGGFVGGAQIGFNYQIGGVVFGFEADFDGSMATKSITGLRSLVRHKSNAMVCNVTRPYRLAFDRVLVYATAGGAGHPTSFHR